MQKITALKQREEEIRSTVENNKRVMNSIDEGYPQYGELLEENKLLTREFGSIGRKIRQAEFDLRPPMKLPGGGKTPKNKGRKRGRKTNKKRRRY